MGLCCYGNTTTTVEAWGFTYKIENNDINDDKQRCYEQKLYHNERFILTVISTIRLLLLFYFSFVM